MGEERLWKSMTLKAWNATLNAKIEMNDSKHLNYLNA